LKQVSLQGINIRKIKGWFEEFIVNRIDLIRLIGGRSMVFPCKLTYNELFLSFTILVDIEAGGYIFIDIKTVRRLYKRLGFPYITDFKPIPILEFDGIPNQKISYVIIIYLYIDNRMISNTIALILDINKIYDVILRYRWLTEYDVIIDYRNKILKWLKG
jgi:hypothetical protein